jgi:hypothetical protein
VGIAESGAELVDVARRALMVEQTPVVEFAPVPEQVPAAEQVTVAELAPTTDETIVILPVEGRVSPAETARDESVATHRPEPDVALPSENHEEHPPTVAAADFQLTAAPQIPSHHDRKVLRKIAQLEKRRIRILKDDRSLSCR